MKFALLLVACCYLLVSYFDWQDAKAEECFTSGGIYIPDTDTCKFYSPTKGN